MRRIFVGIFAALLLFATLAVWRSLRNERRADVAPCTPDQPAESSPNINPSGLAMPAVGNRTTTNPTAAGAASLSSPVADKNDPTHKRLWDATFLTALASAAKGRPIKFELINGQQAVGTIQHTERKKGELIYVAGVLSEPETGKFFFQKQTGQGRAGDFVGVVEFPASKTAWRIEPTGPGGAPELVERPLEQVICMRLPPPADAPPEIPPLYPDDFPTVPIPEYQDGTVVLESLHGAVGVIYLDFHAGYTPTWVSGGITYASWGWTNTKIRDIWQYMSEDYLPFNINVTTDLKVFQNAPETSRIRVIFTPTTTAAPGAGGVAYYDSWNWSGDTPVWVFNSGTKSAAEAGSHEVGHSLNLHHDGKNPSTTYYSGQGSGATGWAPIMGTGYTRDVVQFSKGEYTDANQTENDLSIIIANNSVDYRTDDTGSTLATSRYLEAYAGNTVWAQGVVERTADTDAFQFTTTGGAISLTASPSPVSWANLGISATLADASNTIIASNNPQNVLSASISTNLPAGTYTIRVTGAGRNDPATDGFSDYASLGYYTITGSVAGVRLPTRFTIGENTANATLVGVVTANNPGGNPLTYTIVSGNTGNTFAINSAGNLTVANNALLNYETLAANVQLAVQFEMFVNITNTVTPAQTELNRRVLVTITNVNEVPTLSAGFTTNVLEHTLVGTVIGGFTSSDPDFYNLLTYSIVSGDTNGMFAIGNESGLLSVAGNLIAATQNIYSLKVVVSDSTLTATSTVTVTVQANNSPFMPGSLNYAAYLSLPDNTIASLTNAPNFPLAPDVEKIVTLAEGDIDWADDYGATLRGYLIAPTNGSYRFFLASDNAGQLFLSTNALASASTNPANMKLIASITTDNYADSRQWNKYASQRSFAFTLTGGQAYYLEARMKETFGGDNLAIGWTAPGFAGTNVIPGNYLAPFDPFTTDDLTWAGGGSVATGWHDPNNWTPAFRPRPWNTVTFDTFGATNGPGLVDSVVSANLTAGPLLFRNQTPDFHTIQINPGVTLAFTNSFVTTGDTLGYRGALADSSLTGYVTIKGAGRLIVGDTNNPSTVVGNQIRVHAVASALPPSTTIGANTNGPFMCTLDLSGLDYFATATGEIKVGASASSGRGTRGTMILAKTNLVICGTATNNFYGLIIGSAHGGDYQPGGSMGELQLGVVNDIRANSIKAGAHRAQLGTIKFKSGLTNPRVTMRNVDGTSAVDLIAIGDNYKTSSTGGATSTAETSTGVMDLSGGTVDILVDSLRVGRSLGAAGASSGSGNGTLTWTAGIIQCNSTTEIGRQSDDNRANCTGVVNVRSNAVLRGDDIHIGSDAGPAQSGTGTGTLNIVYGGQVILTNSITEDIAGGGSSTINLTNGTLTTGGSIVVDNVNLINGVISNTGPLVVSRLIGTGTIIGPVTVTNLFAPGTSIGTLNISNDLVFTSTTTNIFEINLNTLACDKVVGLDSVTYGGRLVVTTNVSGLTAATNGASLKLFSAATYSGAFNVTNLPALGAGLAWDTTGLTNGTLRIVSTVPPVSTTRTNIVMSVTGNQLDLSWPADHTGWRLQGQTNKANVGISNNWFTVPGSAATNRVILPVNRANGAVFYRLIYP